MTPVFITVSRAGYGNYRGIINRCARCSAEMPITSDNGERLEITVWQHKGKDYCCKEHARPQ